MKKTLIICGAVVLVAVIALVLVLVLKADGTGIEKEFDKGEKTRELPDMTYEEFIKGIDENLSREVRTQVDALFEEYQSAGQERRAQIFDELINLKVYKGKIDEKEWYDEQSKREYEDKK